MIMAAPYLNLDFRSVGCFFFKTKTMNNKETFYYYISAFGFIPVFTALYFNLVLVAGVLALIQAVCFIEYLKSKNNE